MTIKEIRAYYEQRVAELERMGVVIPNDLERIGILLAELDKHDR